MDPKIITRQKKKKWNWERERKENFFSRNFLLVFWIKKKKKIIFFHLFGFKKENQDRKFVERI